jgi:Spy/CpxP family protein refolding chaperone
MRLFRNSLVALAFILGLGLSLYGQAAKGAWWNGPTIKALNLSTDQMRQMRITVREYRPRLQELRASVQKAEQDLENVFNAETVDEQKANETIDRLVAARSDLSRALSQMGLKLRSILTLQQWQEVQKRFAARVAARQATN